jgi:hypothetical protein
MGQLWKGTMTRRGAAAMLMATTTLLNAAPAQAVDLDALAKYLGFIESFQHIFEFCQAETKLSDKAIKYARDHIGERRALILSGLNERQRERVYTDAEAMRGKVFDQFVLQLDKDQPSKDLPKLCRTDGFFAGVIASEARAQDKEVAAIRKAKITR